MENDYTPRVYKQFNGDGNNMWNISSKKDKFLINLEICNNSSHMGYFVFW